MMLNKESKIIPAKVFFFRPYSLLGSDVPIIIGTTEPDQVVVKIGNGSWVEIQLTATGRLQFVTGVYSINPKCFSYDFYPDTCYYIKCTLIDKGLEMSAQLEMLPVEQAQTEITSLTKQENPK